MSVCSLTDSGLGASVGVPSLGDGVEEEGMKGEGSGSLVCHLDT